MKFLAAFAAYTGFAAAIGLNTSREYLLHTKVKTSAAATKKFDNLYVYSYHTSAGLGDAALAADQSGAAKGFLNNTNSKGVGNQLFDLGTGYPWYQENAISDTFYTGWQPIRINTGSATSDDVFTYGFFFNATGLQWTTTPMNPGGAGDSFGGWIVCNWWHGVPQLFVRLALYNTPAPTSCADVTLVPKYL